MTETTEEKGIVEEDWNDRDDCTKGTSGRRLE
jgi:hypothetical protein